MNVLPAAKFFGHLIDLLRKSWISGNTDLGIVTDHSSRGVTKNSAYEGCITRKIVYENFVISKS